MEMPTCRKEAGQRDLRDGHVEIELIEFTKIINPPWCGTAGVEDHFLPMGSCV